MGDFKKIFSEFEGCSLTWFERELISEVFPVIKQAIESLKTLRGDGTRPKYDTSYTDRRKIFDFKEKIEKIVKVLDSSDQKREKFLKNFPAWKTQREKNIEKLRKIAESMKEFRKVSNVVKITAGSVGVVGGAVIVGSLLFPPAAPALLPSWLGGATLASALPSVFLGAAPAVSPLAVAGGVAAAGGAAGNVVATITELVLTNESLDEVKKVIDEDRKLLEQLGVLEFFDDLNKAIDDLFGKSTSSKILNDLIDFLTKVPPILDDMRPILEALSVCLTRILPGLTKFLVIGISLASVILSIFFVVFLVRRRGCTILNHRHALGFMSAIDASVEVTRLIAAAGLKGSKLGELIPRKLAGKIAVGAMAGVGLVLDTATIVISSIDLAEGSLSDEAKMIFEVAKNLESHLEKYQCVHKELENCGIRRSIPRVAKCWTGVIINHIPLNADPEDITASIKRYLSYEAWDCILLERLRTNGNNWLVEVPTSCAHTLLRQNYINVKGESCLVMK